MEMNEQGDEVSLLDLMLVVVEDIRLLILGPLLAGLLALCVATFCQKNRQQRHFGLAHGSYELNANLSGTDYGFTSGVRSRCSNSRLVKAL